MFFHDDVFWTSLQNTLVYMASAPIGIALALGLALLVNAGIRGRTVYWAIIFVSYPLMTVAVGIIWRWLYDGSAPQLRADPTRVIGRASPSSAPSLGHPAMSQPPSGRSWASS
jgi:ABC-type sugar transport system permease subunit